MAKEKFEISIEYNYKLVAIATSLKDYRVSFILNEALNIDLKKVDNLVVDSKIKSKRHSYEKQEYVDVEMQRSVFLLSNKCLGSYLLSSLKKFDYILIIKSENEIEDYVEIVSKLKDIEKFQVVYKIDTLSKRENKLIEDNIIYIKKQTKKNLNENSHK